MEFAKKGDVVGEHASSPQIVRQTHTRRYSICVFDDGSAEATWDWSSVKRRKPVRFRKTADGAVVPEARGADRQRILEEFGHVMDSFGPFQPPGDHIPTDGTFDGVRLSDQRGTPRGRGPDPEATRRFVEQFMRDNPDKTVAFARGEAMQALNIGADTVSSHLYRTRPTTPPLPRRPVDEIETERDWDTEARVLEQQLSGVLEAAEALINGSEPVELRALQGLIDLGRATFADLEGLHKDEAEAIERSASEFARWVFEMAEASTLGGYPSEVIDEAIAYFCGCDPIDVSYWYALGASQTDVDGVPKWKPLTTRSSVHKVKELADHLSRSLGP